MNDFDTLRDLLRDDVMAPVSQSGQDINFVLNEQCGQQYTLNVTGAPHDAVAFKADRFPPPKPVFKNSKHECKRADYVIIASGKSNGWIIYVEMKRTKAKEIDVEQQLRGAKCVVAYCRAIVREFWCDHKFLNGYHERFVSVGYIGINKRATRAPRRRIHDNPKDMLKVRATKGTVPFQRLLYGR